MYGAVMRGVKANLRPPTDDEIPALARQIRDPEGHPYDAPSLRAASWWEEWFRKSAESPNKVLWAVDVEGKAIGTTNIRDIEWINRTAVTGISILKEYWGRGVGSEAIALRTAYAFRELNLNKLKTYTAYENEPIKRALRKVGYREVGVSRQERYLHGRFRDEWLAELLREDWERAQT